MVTVESHGYPVQRLGEIMTLEYGEGLPDNSRSGSGVPVFGSNGVVGFHKKGIVSGPGIVVGRKGTIGKVTWTDGDFWPIDTTYYVRCRTGHNLRWLYYLLDYIGLRRLNAATGVPGLNRSDVYGVKVPVPSPEQTCRIVEIVDSADNAIAQMS